MEWLILAFVAATGALNTVQAGANAELAKSLGQPWPAALAVYVVGFSALLAVAAVLAWAGRAGSVPTRAEFAAVPWWAWTGGVLGAGYVVAMLLFAERLGSAAFSAITVSAGLITAVALDHFGIVGFRQHVFNAWRGLGVALLLAGVGLISRF